MVTTLLNKLHQTYEFEALERLKLQQQLYLDSLVELTKSPPCIYISIYDTASAIGIEGIDSNKLLQSINEMQHPNGLWGEYRILPQSAMVDTLAAIAAYIRVGKTIPNYQKIKSSIDELAENSVISQELDPVGYEFIVTTLGKYIKQFDDILNSEVCSEFFDKLNKEVRRKAHLLSVAHPGISISKLITIPGSNLQYSAEILEYLEENELLEIEYEKVLSMILDNDSIAVSPSATAGIIRLLKRKNLEVPEGLIKYIEKELDKFLGKGLPVFSDASNLQTVWNYLPLLMSDKLPLLLAENVGLAEQQYSKIGFSKAGDVGWDPLLNFGDLDDTVCALWLKNGLAKITNIDQAVVDLSVINRFRNAAGEYITYPSERNGSKSVALHTLLYLERLNEFNLEVQIAIEVLIKQLKPSDTDVISLRDKWQVSPAYNFHKWFSSKIVIKSYPNESTQMLIDILTRQTDSGGWSFTLNCEESLEETALIVLGLISVINIHAADQNLSQYRGRIMTAILNAKSFFKNEFGSDNLMIQPFWVAKNLYAGSWALANILAASLLITELEIKG